MLGVPYSNNRQGGHATKYDDNIKVNYYSLTIQDIYNKREYLWSPSIESWFTQDNIQLINELYKDDFEWLGNYGFDYLIN